MTARLEQQGGANAKRPTAAPPRGRALATSAAVMASGTLVSRVLGLLRNALLVAVVGLVVVGTQGGSMADAWSVANKLPNIISMLLAGGILNAVLVPQVVRAMRRRDGGEEHVNRLLTAAIAILFGVTVVLTAAATLLIHLYAASFPPEWKAVAVALAYWCIPQLFFYGLYTLLGQVLNARSIFGPYMWAPAVNNLVAIAGLVAFLVMFGGLPDGGLPPEAWTADRITLLAGSATLGVVAQALVLIVPLYRSGFRFRPVWGVRGHGLGKASSVAMWAFAALAIGQLGYLAVSNVAAAASARDFAGNFAYDNAFLIFMLPQSLVTVSLVTALFTRVASNAAARDGAKVRDDLSLGLRTLGIFTVFATAAFAVLAIPLVQVVLLDRADFTSYRAVAAVLVAMAAGLTSMAVWTMVQRVFYAYEDTRMLFRIQVPMAVILALGCVLSWWLLEPQWWVAGAGAATTVSNTVGATVGYLATRKYLPNLDGARVLRTHLRVVMAMLPIGLAGWGVLHLWGVETSFVGALLRVVVLGVLMLAGYLALVRALRVEELGGLMARVRGPLAVMAARLPGPLAALLPRTMSGSRGGTGRGDQAMTTGSSVSLGAGEMLAARYRLDLSLPSDVPHGAAWSGVDTIVGDEVRVLLVDGPQRDHTIDAARRAALIGDHRLPRVLRAGVEEGQGYVVTEAAPGVSLADLVRDGGLAPSQARALVGEAAAALEAARRRGVHHLALRPSDLVRTEDGEVRLLGLGTHAAARGIEVRDARAAARQDAVGLVQLLYTALTGTWPGAPELADGLPQAPENEAGVVPAGDAVTGVPNDLDTLCAVTLGDHDDGPVTPGDLVADLAPWGAIDVSAAAGPLPPRLAPTPGGLAPMPASTPEPPQPPSGDDGLGDVEATAVHSIDTSGWAPHPLPTVSEPAPFSDLVTDTGSIPVVRVRPQHASPLRAQRPGEVRAVLDVAAGAAAAAGAGAAGAAADVSAAGAGVASGAGAAGVVGAARAAATHEPEAPVDDRASRPDEADLGELLDEHEPMTGTTAEAGDAVGVIPEEEGDAVARVAEPPLPMLARTPRGWDVPGGTVEVFAGEEPSPAMRTGTARTGAGAAASLGTAAKVVGSASATAATKVADGVRGLRGTNRKINEVSEKVTGGTRQVLHGVGERLGSVTGRAGAFVDEVRDEFRPIEEERGEDGRSRFNPAPIALCVMVGLVIFGLVMAVLTLRDAATAFTPGPDPGVVAPTATPPEPSAEPTAEATEEPTTEPEGENEGPPPASRVEISEGVTFDPTVSGGENQENAYLAFDGNADTTWNSLRYNSPTYGMKDGLGFTVVLERTALVSSVTLDVAGDGGTVEIRVASPDAPNQGTVLASGPMGHDVTYTFDEPVEAESIALWFPELPVADSDGRNRIELAEIELG